MSDTDLEAPNFAAEPGSADGGGDGGGDVTNEYQELFGQANGGDPADAPGTDPADDPGTDPADAPGTDPADVPIGDATVQAVETAEAVAPAEEVIEQLAAANEIAATPETSLNPEELKRLDKIRRALKQNLHEHHQIYIMAGWALAIAVAGEVLGAPTIVSLLAEVTKMALAVWVQHHKASKIKAALP